MSGPIRIASVVFGFALVGVGGVATFVGELGAGAAALVVVGAVALLFAAAGQWPDRITYSGASVEFRVVDIIRNRIDELIALAPDSTRATLEQLRREVSEAQVNHAPNNAPALRYDDEVERALRRAAPDALIRRDERWSRERADFWLKEDEQRLLVETKYVGATPLYRGSTLGKLIERAHRGERLLVITNASDPSGARRRVVDELGDDGDVVTWRGPEHDPELAAAVQRLLAD